MGTTSLTSESGPRSRQATTLLSAEDCAIVIDAARPWLRVCAPAIGTSAAGAVSAVAGATSVACLPEEAVFQSEFVEIAGYLRTLIAALSGLPEENQELFQVVHQTESGAVDPGHGILFPGWEFLKSESDSGGERVFSFILYLNDVEEGGATDCPHLGISIQPEEAKVVFWRTPVEIPGYGRGMHASHPVIRGEKWLLACWVRETACRRPSMQEVEAIARNGCWNIGAMRYEPARIEPPRWMVQQSDEQRLRTTYLGAGGPECRGFERRTLDAATFADIRATYASIQHRLRPEANASIGTFLQTISREAPPALFRDDKHFNDALLERLRPIHEEWCGLKLQPSACYGFRVYLPGAFLHNHVDIEATHIVSSTICVDREVGSAWPLTVVDIDGRECDVDLEPGEFVLYESAKISHGRPTPFKGRFHVGLFLHYRPVTE